MLTVKKISKTFDNYNYIVKDFSCSFSPSTITAIIGESGKGKTTILQMIGNMMPVTQGEVLLNNQNIANISKQEIGFIFQNHNLLKDITVRENIEIPLLLTNMPRKKINARVDEIIETFQIKSIADLYYNQISGGQSQRVAVARAMINNPKILIADEPTSNLDDTNNDIIMKALNIAKDKFKTIIIFSTHKKSNLIYADEIIKIE